MEPVAPVIDLSRASSGSGIAESQFYGLIAQTTFGTKVPETGFAVGEQRSDVSPTDVLAGWQTRGDWQIGWAHIRVAELRGRIAMVTANHHDGSVRIEMFSNKGSKDAHAALTVLLALCPTVPEPEKGVEARFWYATAMGPNSQIRPIDAPDWGDVAVNYPAGLRANIAEMAAWSTPPSGTGGKLLLMHGPPGTGKTWVLRALARAWHGWSDLNVITDPDEFFGSSAYMLSVLLNHDHGVSVLDDPTPRWQVVVLEDCDEILSANARDRSGHRVSRLLNVCDGMVGQGLRILLLLTTNETVDNFHPAIVRPGRCLKNLFFDKFDAAEADSWRAEHGLIDSGDEATLADLYQETRLDRHAQIVKVADKFRSGLVSGLG